MTRHLSLSQERERRELQYIDRVLATDPIAYWPLDERFGSVAYDLVSGRVTGAKYGAHVGVTLGERGIGDGGTAGLNDGINDYTNISSPDLAGAEELVNGGFETAGGGGADIWGTWVETAGDGALADEVVLVHGGAHAAKVTAGPTLNTKVAETIAVVPGLAKTLLIWTAGDGVHAGRYRVYDVTHGADIVPVTSTGVVAAVYAQVPVTFSVPFGCTSIRLDLMCPATNGGIAYFDDISQKSTVRFNGAEGTLLIWAKVANAGVWTDGLSRFVVRLAVDANNWIKLFKYTDNFLYWQYKAAGTLKSVNAALTPSAFFCMAMAWSKSGDALKAYYGGSQQGATQVGLGTWAGALDATGATIGSSSLVPTDLWFGNIAMAALWSRALIPAQVAYVSKV